MSGRRMFVEQTGDLSEVKPGEEPNTVMVSALLGGTVTIRILDSGNVQVFAATIQLVAIQHGPSVVLGISGNSAADVVRLPPKPGCCEHCGQKTEDEEGSLLFHIPGEGGRCRLVSEAKMSEYLNCAADA